jgi:hypothetical protein
MSPRWYSSLIKRQRQTLLIIMPQLLRKPQCGPDKRAIDDESVF